MKVPFFLIAANAAVEMLPAEEIDIGKSKFSYDVV